MKKVNSRVRVFAAILSLPFWNLMIMFFVPIYYGEPLKFDMFLPFAFLGWFCLSWVAILGKVPLK
jgi:hypothetical protein